MSLTATYNGDLSRVQLAATLLGATATYAVVERSLNETLWLPVRGGLTLPVESQEAELSDYEFFDGAENFYRLTSFDVDDVQQEQFADSITPELDSVWLKNIRYPLLNMAVKVLDRGEAVSRASRSTVAAIVGRSTGVATHDLRRARAFDLTIITQVVGESGHAEQAAKLDLTLAAGGTFFVHVPAGSAVPGGYVAIDADTVEERLYRADPDAPRVFTLPCQVVTPPAPQITGTLLVAETLFRLYGNAQALIAAHSTNLSLLQTIGSLEDLVVV
jgi:hypothetical protein